MVVIEDSGASEKPQIGNKPSGKQVDTLSAESGQVGQPRCFDLPNDAPEGHYWSWVQAPKSIPTHYRECMTCGRLDASEYIANREKLARIDELEGLIINTERQQILAGNDKTFDRKPIYREVDYVPIEVVKTHLSQLKENKTNEE